MTMNALLNVFINVLTATGEVKALTLTLTELEAGDSTYLFDTLLGGLHSADEAFKIPPANRH